MDCEIPLQFGDGEYLFDLKLPQIIELQDKCGFVDTKGNRKPKGILAIYASVMAGRGTIDGEPVGIPTEADAEALEIKETIRLGLIGGAQGEVDGETVEVTPLTAKTLVNRYFDLNPIAENWDIAAAILHARVVGYTPKKPKKKATKKPMTGSN